MTELEKKNQIIQWVVTGILLALGFYNQLAQIKGWAHFEIGDAVLTRYVTWFYELIVGAWAFWHNNNITSFAQLTQLVLDALKRGTITEGQVEALINNNTVKMVIDADINDDLIETFLTDTNLQKAAQAHLEDKEVTIEIQD